MKDGLLGKVLGDVNANIFLDTPSIIRLVLGALGAGILLIFISKLLDKLIK